MNKALFSSRTEEWSTPQDFFDKLNAEFGPFDLDPCATPENAKCKKFFTKEQDGLAQVWDGKVFMNPPYGRDIGLWMEKAFRSSKLVVCLVPARTDTKWWHSWVEGRAKVRFIKGRLKFGGAKYSAPFPNAVVIFNPS